MINLKYHYRIFLVITLLTVLSLILINYNYSRVDLNHQPTKPIESHKRFKAYIREKPECHDNYRYSKRCSRWILIISSNSHSPTQSITDMADAFSDNWCVAIVLANADLKNSWCYKDTILLDKPALEKLANEFDLYVSSSRGKILAYLYAIQNGAEFIFESNGDLFLTDGLHSFRYESFNGLENPSQRRSSQDELIFDPNAFYKNENFSTHLRIYQDQKNVPSIQQGLAIDDDNGRFDENSPPIVLARDQYIRIDTRNVMFAYKSFWSLVVPFVAQNYEEIRDVVAVRLMREFGARVAVVPTASLSLKNFKRDLKNLDRRLVELVEKWKCKEDKLQACFLTCVEFLIEKKFLNESERLLYRNWTNALELARYRWPQKTLQQSPEEDNNKNEKWVQTKHLRIFEKSKSSKSQLVQLNSTCHSRFGSNTSLQLIDQLILVTFSSSQDDLNFISTLYGIFFSYIIVCTRTPFDELNIKPIYGMTLITFNSTSIECLNEAALLMGYRLQSFLIVMSPRQFDFWNYDFVSEESVSLKTVDHYLDDEKYFKREKDVYFIRSTVAESLRQLKLKKVTFHKTICDYYEKENDPMVFRGLQDILLERLEFHQNNLVSESCSGLDSRTIWLLDSNDGVRVDVTSTLVHLNQKVILLSPKLGRSAYPEAIRLGQISYSLSDFVKTYENLRTDEKLEPLFRENFAYYQNRTEFRDQADALFCASPMTICEGFASLNRTLILSPWWKYNERRCDVIRWSRLNRNLMTLVARSKAIVGSMSRFAREYLEFNSHYRAEFRLYSYAGFYAPKNFSLYPTRTEILVGPNRLSEQQKMWVKDLRSFYMDYSRNRKDSVSVGFEFVRVREKYSFYTLADLSMHPAVVYFPSTETSYSLIEFYIACVPIFVPSRAALIANGGIHYENNCPDDLVNNWTDGIHPNDDSYWLRYADFYQLPFITLFDSWPDLIEKLDDVSRLQNIRDRMRWANRLREADLLGNWCRVLKSLPPPGNFTKIMPSSYNKSLDYFGLTSFQV